MIQFPIAILTAWLLHLDQTAHLTHILGTRGAKPAVAADVALLIQHHARDQHVDPYLVTAIVTVENPALRNNARNASGATGIMQVMPGWLRLRPDWGRECGANLAKTSTNICFGIRVLRLHLAEHPTSVRKGLLAFNGCRKVSCRSYPTIVLRRQAQYANR
jgi:hypothetical protein